jgi:hypothetical protein
MGLFHCGANSQSIEHLTCWGTDGSQEVGSCRRCAVSQCCSAHGFDTCAECDDMPCELLMAFSYDPTKGDGGARIHVLNRLRAEMAT